MLRLSRHPSRLLVVGAASAGLLLAAVGLGFFEGTETDRGITHRLDGLTSFMERQILEECADRDGECVRSTFQRVAPAIGSYGMRLWEWKESHPRLVADRPLDGTTAEIPPSDEFWSGTSRPGPCHEDPEHHRCRTIIDGDNQFVGVLEISSNLGRKAILLPSLLGALGGAVCLLSGILLVAFAERSRRWITLLFVLILTSGLSRIATQENLRAMEVEIETQTSSFLERMTRGAAFSGGSASDHRSPPDPRELWAPRERLGAARDWIGHLGILGWIVLCTSLALARRKRSLDELLCADTGAAELLRLKSIFESTRAVWWEWNLQAKTAQHDPRIALLLGHAAQVLDLEDPDLWLKLCHPNDREEVQLAIRNHLQGITPRIQRDLRLRHGDGTWGWYTLTGSAVERSSDGLQVKRLTGTIEDASVRRKMEDDLHQLDQKSSEALRRLKIGNTALEEFAIVAMTDAKGVIRSVNRNFCRISGYQEGELLGKTHKVVNSGTHPPEFFRTMWQTLNDGRVWRGRICNRAKSGRLYWVDTMIFPHRDHEGRITEFLTVRREVAPPSDDSMPPLEATTWTDHQPPDSVPLQPAIGLEGLHRRMLDNRELRDKVLGLYLEKTPALIESIELSLRSREQEVCALLHSLKGSSLNIEAVETAKLAQHLEDLFQAGKFQEAEDTFPALRKLAERTCGEAEAIRRS
jgi:PAS domain S-box-containing protein